MNDLISRQAAIDEVKQLYEWHDTVTEDRLINHLKRLPSAQPERKTGKWTKISPASIYECSVCGQNIMTQDIDVYSYCHGCGAKMEVNDGSD